MGGFRPGRGVGAGVHGKSYPTLLSTIPYHPITHENRKHYPSSTLGCMPNPSTCWVTAVEGGSLSLPRIKQGEKMTTIDRIKATGVSSEAMLQVTQLCNRVRLAADAAEVQQAESQANCFVTGLWVGGGISEHQKEQLLGLFGDIAARTNAQHATAMAITKSSAVEPDFESEKQTFERSAAEVGLPLEKLKGGFYVSQETQHAWSFWIRRAAIAGAVAKLVDEQNLNVLVGFIQDLLADTIRDLERQVSPEFRGQFYGECRGLLKAMRVAKLLDEAQLDQWSADIYRASLQAAEQCLAAGQPADESSVNQQRFQLEQLANRGIKPRVELPR